MFGVPKLKINNKWKTNDISSTQNGQEKTLKKQIGKFFKLKKTSQKIFSKIIKVTFEIDVFAFELINYVLLFFKLQICSLSEIDLRIIIQ